MPPPLIYNQRVFGLLAARPFQYACKMRLEGIVSKHKQSRYRSGRSPVDQEQEPDRSSGEERSRGGC